MNAIAQKDLARWRTQLLARRDELRRAVHAALLQTKEQTYADLAGQVHDLGDESSAELLMDVELAAHARELEELNDVEAALERIKSDRFGRCVECNDAINPDRLNAYPTAKRCLACQNVYETRRRGGKDTTPSL
jgi:RNA polymerase-binding protein DksA